MQSPPESTTSVVTSAMSSPSNSTSNITSADLSAATSTPTATKPLPVLAASSTPTSATSASPSATIADDIASTSLGNATGVPPAFCELDPQQLTFQIGPSSRSPSKAFAVRSPSGVAVTLPPGVTVTPSCMAVTPSGVTITAVPSTSGSRPGTSTGLFESAVVAEASRAPGRFKFQTQPPAADRAPAAARKVATLPGKPATTRPANNGAQGFQFSDFNSQTQRALFPNLSPDVVIRPVHSSNRVKNSYEGGSKQTAHPALQDSEIFQLLSGYRHLKDEVSSLKVQLTNSQTLMQEILNNFSSEVEKINCRLTALEQRVGHGHGIVTHGHGIAEHGHGIAEHGHGIVEHGHGIVEHGHGNVDETGDDNGNDEQDLSVELRNMTLTKENNDK